MHHSRTIYALKASQDNQLFSRTDSPPITQNVQITGGTHFSAGGDVNNVQSNIHNVQNNVQHHYHEAAKASSISALDSIDNFRAIQQDSLSKRTPKTGEWIFDYEQFPVWRNPNSSLKTLWGSGIAGAGKTVLT